MIDLRTNRIDWSLFDGTEVHPCVALDEHNQVIPPNQIATSRVVTHEQCETDDPDIHVWSLYLHYDDTKSDRRGLAWVCDTPTVEIAQSLMEVIDEMHFKYNLIPDCTDEHSEIQNLDQLLDAGMPAKFEYPLVQAYLAFNECTSDLYPEINSGDTVLVEEPTNVLAMWICESEQIHLERTELATLPRAVPHKADPQRFDASLTAGIEAAKKELIKYLPNIQEPSEHVRALLSNVLSEFVGHNLPDPDESDRAAPAPRRPSM